ncbi:hypothetical protein C1T17_05685 [Sphingobium sp. SCG-1]|uniref:hypothetical protein n=1 Tax=Sphingobium sp. SCG-1 TaxID=2072936 RepID=UPI000CD67FBB|nr:hypothetical protein [Sphingobium sp. SCG-1]AUW57671.1 hypothetical protein C1T17_05685 [Sphingobium sp. SCG-1]
MDRDRKFKKTARVITSLLVATATLVVSACQKQDDAPALDNVAIRNSVEEVEPVNTASVSDAANETQVSPTTTESSGSESGLPTAFRGRWGMVRNDCDLSRSDTKGLVTVSASSLKFYESLGQLKSIDAVSPTEVKARFDFSGEGQNWTKTMTLKLENGGTTLVRIEQNPSATFRHEKCA